LHYYKLRKGKKKEKKNVFEFNGLSAATIGRAKPDEIQDLGE